jgi:hypothetical protein
MHIYLNCKLVTFLHFIFALVSVGTNHQKGGDWKGNGLNHFLESILVVDIQHKPRGLTSLSRYHLSRCIRFNTNQERNSVGVTIKFGAKDLECAEKWHTRHCAVRQARQQRTSHSQVSCGRAPLFTGLSGEPAEQWLPACQRSTTQSL